MCVQYIYFFILFFCLHITKQEIFQIYLSIYLSILFLFSTYKINRADLSQRKADEETARILAEKAAAATEEGEDGENTEDITITSDTSTTISNGGEIPDVSPSALPTTESQLQPAATVASIGGSATGAGKYSSEGASIANGAL